MKSLAVLAFAVLALGLPRAFAQDSETTAGGNGNGGGSGSSSQPSGDGTNGAFANGNTSGSNAVAQEDPAVKAANAQAHAKTDIEGEPLLPVFCPSGKCYQSAFDNESSVCDSGGKGAGPGTEPCMSAAGSGYQPAAPISGQKTQ